MSAVTNRTFAQWLRNKAETTEDVADAADFALAADVITELCAELQQFVNGVETRMIDSPADETLANITHRARAALAKARGEQ